MRHFVKATAGGLVALALAAGGMATSADAATATATIAVSANVLANCGVSASPLAFGTYSPAASSATNATTTLAVTCTNGTTYTVSLSAGSGTGATIATRKLTSGSNTLNYSLYSNAAATTVWGDTVGTNTVAGTGSGAAQNLTVYGSIPASQNAFAGSYTDTVNVTLTY